MKEPQPIIVVDLFPEMLDGLLDLLAGLAATEWEAPTSCSLWSVKDVALHLLGGEVGVLSRKRDRYSFISAPLQNWDELVAFINGLNDLWVKAARRMSPRLLHDLLKMTGTQVCEYFRSLDPYALGDPVDWAGPEPAPVWFDLAREYTERWHHQQQIRDAVAKPGLKQPRYFRPVLDTFVRALPHTYREVAAEEGTVVGLSICGDSGGRWFLVREEVAWSLRLDAPRSPHAEVVVPQDVAWKLFTRGIGPDEALAQATVLGDRRLGLKALEMVSVLA